MAVTRRLFHGRCSLCSSLDTSRWVLEAAHNTNQEMAEWNYTPPRVQRVCVCWGEVWVGSLGLGKLMTPVPALGHDTVILPVPTGKRRRILFFTPSPPNLLTFIIISYWWCWDWESRVLQSVRVVRPWKQRATVKVRWTFAPFMYTHLSFLFYKYTNMSRRKHIYLNTNIWLESFLLFLYVLWNSFLYSIRMTIW